ncbi:hypothetical protein [Candidatus Solirubrobacter pratensis]|uniref:hypothetical protein n=1 Tax=Candidatus Solirubrobacter pratensis TaxID=1298857 RepID=UPI000428BC52|nr:hypothetical protein [Candidatus Solirubrobacter pratensis]
MGLTTDEPGATPGEPDKYDPAGVRTFARIVPFSGITANDAAQVFKDFAAALPHAKLYGPDGVADTTFANPEQGIPADTSLTDYGVYSINDGNLVFDRTIKAQGSS